MGCFMIYKQALLCYGLFHDIQTNSIMLWVVSLYTNKLYYVLGCFMIYKQALLCDGLFHDIQTSSIM